MTKSVYSISFPSGESPRIDIIRVVVGAVKYEKIIPTYSSVMDPRGPGGSEAPLPHSRILMTRNVCSSRS